MSDPAPSKEKLPDWLRRWYALKGEPRFREAADEIERLQSIIKGKTFVTDSAPEPEPDERDADTCRLEFQAWANDLDLCLDEIFMSSAGVPEHPYEDNDTNQFWRAWLASWKAKRTAQPPSPALRDVVRILEEGKELASIFHLRGAIIQALMKLHEQHPDAWPTATKGDGQ